VVQGGKRLAASWHQTFAHARKRHCSARTGAAPPCEISIIAIVTHYSLII
jgi:hypothetical protein